MIARFRILWERFLAFRRSPRKFIVTIALAVLVLILGIYSIRTGRSRQKLVYAESLDLVAVSVNGSELTLRDLAFYVAYEEQEVYKEALVYDADDPKKYWNLHIDGVFVADAARNAAIQMAIHDELFYRMAVADEGTLSEEERAAMESSEEDFWNDLCDEDQTDRLGITREDLHRTMERIALAQRYQTIYALSRGEAYEEYAFSEEAYEAYRDKQKIKIADQVWNRVDIGSVTLSYE